MMLPKVPPFKLAQWLLGQWMRDAETDELNDGDPDTHALYEATKAFLRESGDSVPAECPCGEGKNPLHAFLNCGQAPVLNKSGGPKAAK